MQALKALTRTGQQQLKHPSTQENQQQQLHRNQHNQQAWLINTSYHQ